MQKQLDKWKHASAQMTLWLKRKQVLTKLGKLAEMGHEMRAFNKWLKWNAHLKDQETLKQGVQSLAEALYLKRRARKAFRQWVEVSHRAALEEAFGGALPEPAPAKEQALKVAAAAAKPFFNRAGRAEEAGKHDESMKSLAEAKKILGI